MESVLKVAKAELYDAISEMSDGDPKELAALKVIDAIDELLAAMAANPPLPVMTLTDDDMAQLDAIGAQAQEDDGDF